MKKPWKRFVAWATALQSNIFAWARIKLTALYLLIIILVLGVYSAAMYIALTTNIRNEVIETADQMIRHQVYEAAVDHIQFQILVIDVAIFLIAAIGSYVLAGITLRPIKRAHDAQEAFSADASHELRTPLAIMKTDIEVLLRGKEAVPESVRAVLNSNLEEINNLTTMTSDLLELSRGKISKTEPVVVSDVVRQEVGQLQVLAAQKNITLSLSATSIKTVRGDSQAFSRVFKNIIANALTYTDDSGEVGVSVKDGAGQVFVTVTDNGKGISDRDLPHIFKRFYKADNARSGNGTGLGLALTKEIVEQYGGTIAIQSTLNKGTTVIVALPIK